LNREQIITILESLANGIDRGNESSDFEALDTPDAIRALFLAARMLREGALASPVSRRGHPAAAGTRWSHTEDAALCAAHDDGLSIDDLSGKHKRTRGAIISRLVKLGRLEPTLGPEASRKR
jgi:hypothetical protein